MALNATDNPKARRPKHASSDFSLHSTLDSYEVKEVSARQVARYLARRRGRSVTPQSSLPDSAGG